MQKILNQNVSQPYNFVIVEIYCETPLKIQGLVCTNITRWTVHASLEKLEVSGHQITVHTVELYRNPKWEENIIFGWVSDTDGHLFICHTQ